MNDFGAWMTSVVGGGGGLGPSVPSPVPGLSCYATYVGR